MRAPGWTLFTLVVLLFLVRGISVVGLADVFFYGEEMTRGCAAKAIVDALPVPHYKIGQWYFEGGAFTVAHVTALLFLALGQCLLAHKIAALVMSVLILCAAFALARRSFGMPAAVLTGLLVIFAPESFHRLSYLNLGNHFAATLFLALILGLAFRIAFDDESGVLAYVRLGLASGFGCYFSFQCLPAVGFAWALVVFFRRRELTPRSVLASLISFVIGAAPFLWMWSQAGKEIFRIHEGYLFEPPPEQDPSGSMLASLASLYSGRSSWDLLHVAALHLTPFAGLALVLVRRAHFAARERRSYLALSLYLALFMVVYMRSRFTVEAFDHFFTVNRMSPFWLLGTVLSAATVAHLSTSRGRAMRVTRVGLGVFLLIAGARDAVRVWSEGRFDSLSSNVQTLLDTKGYSYTNYLRYFREHLDGPLEDDLRVVLAFDEPSRTWLRVEAVQALVTKADVSPEELAALFQHLDRDHWREFRAGLGPYLLARDSMLLSGALKSARAAPAEDRAWMLEALGRSGRGAFRQPGPGQVPAALEHEIAMGLERLGPDAPPYLHGLGHRLHRLFQLDPDAAGAAMEAQPLAARDALRRGYDEAREWHRIR